MIALGKRLFTAYYPLSNHGHRRWKDLLAPPILDAFRVSEYVMLQGQDKVTKLDER